MAPAFKLFWNISPNHHYNLLSNNIFPQHEFMLPSTLGLVDHCYSEDIKFEEDD
jgi:hypothetical protein